MNHTVLEILGKAQTAAVKRDAEIGVAQVLILDLNIRHLNTGILTCSDTLLHNELLIFRPTGTPEFARQNAKRLQWM